MSRAENPELKKRLEAAIQRNLCTRGLDATSYQTIADDANISRALVQHYYPRKMDFAINFLERLLSTAASILGIDDYDGHSKIDYLNAYRIGCLYYDYLLSEDGARLMFFDLLKDRELTDEMMFSHYEWALVNVDPNRPTYDAQSQDAIEAWGGFYELLYRSIKQDFGVCVPEKLYSLLKAFHQGSPSPFGTEAEFMTARPDPYLLDELKARMNDFVPRSTRILR